MFLTRWQRTQKTSHPRFRPVVETLEDRDVPTAGAVDQTFAASGVAFTDVGPLNDSGRALAVQTDGRIVVVGKAEQPFGGDFALARYNADGSLDSSFGTGGMVTTDFALRDDGATCVALQSDSKVVVAGYTQEADGSYDFAVVRYNTDGSLDTSFGAGGKVIIEFQDLPNRTVDEFASGVAIQGGGTIVVAGTSGGLF